MIQADETFTSVLEKGHTPSGLIRVMAPVDLGVFRLSTLINSFVQDYPDVEFDLGEEQVDYPYGRVASAHRQVGGN